MKRNLLILSLFLFVLAACGPRNPSATVNGHVYGPWGQPLAGVRVQIADRPLATTAADGSFTVDGVSTPYRAVVEFASDEYAVFDGLTTTEAHFYRPQAFGGSPPQATVEGSLTGTVAGRKAAVAFASTNGFGFDLDNAQDSSTPYSLDAALPDTTATGRLYALEWTTDAGGDADVFTGYAVSGDLTLSGGGLFSGQDLALDPAPSTHDLTVSLAAPVSDYDLRALTASLRPWPNEYRSIPLVHTALGAPLASPATVRSPNLPSAYTALVLLVSESGGTDSVGAAWTTVPATETSASLTVPARPQLLAPADGATNVGSGAAFSWTQPAEGLAAILLSTGPVSLIGFTAGTEFELPDLSSFGTSYGAAAAYSWAVLHFRLEGTATADDLVREGGGSGLLSRLTFPLLSGLSLDGGDGHAVVSAERGFTTP
ncbi:hypothetical protein [Oceanithermus sp.]